MNPTQSSPENVTPPQAPVPVQPAISAPAIPSRAVENELKEYVSALLSVLIVSFTMYFMWKMFAAPDDVGQTLWQHQSAILQIAVGLAGTVTGYYFGRIPAERTASNAQSAANNAQKSLVNTTAIAQQASANESRIRAQIRDLRNQISTPVGGGPATAEADVLRTQLQQRLDQILRG